MSKQQTALQDFWDKIALKLSFEQIDEFLPLFYTAKEMEKEQLMRSNECGFKDGCLYANGEEWAFESPEQYYNETYGGNK